MKLRTINKNGTLSFSDVSLSDAKWLITQLNGMITKRIHKRGLALDSVTEDRNLFTFVSNLDASITDCEIVAAFLVKEQIFSYQINQLTPVESSYKPSKQCLQSTDQLVLSHF